MMKGCLFIRWGCLLSLGVLLSSPAFGARKLAPMPTEEFESPKARERQELRAQTDPKAAYVLACAWMNDKVYGSSREDPILTLLTRAANGDLPDAQYRLGELYEQREDFDKALSFYRKAAAQNLVEACCKMGVFYLSGVTTKRYSSTSRPEYMMMSEKEARAKIPAGVKNNYLYEEILSKNEQKALKLFSEAAKLNLPEANYRIGICFEKALGVPKNKKKAMEWYAKAAKQRHIEAIDALERLEGE